MKYKIAKSRPIGREVRRIAAVQIERALEALAVAEQARAAGAVAQGIHDARRCLKNVRALLRLARQGLGRPAYEAESQGLRDAGREVRPARDAAALVEALDAAGFEHPVPKRVQALRRRLTRQALRFARQAVSGGSIAHAAHSLREALERILEWDLGRLQKKDAVHALRDAGKARKKAGRKARAHPTAANLHRWRKRTTNSLCLMLLLRSLRPKLRKPIKQAQALAKLLGQNRDLLLLARAARAQPRPAAKAFLNHLSARRQALLAAALRRG